MAFFSSKPTTDFIAGGRFGQNGSNGSAPPSSNSSQPYLDAYGQPVRTGFAGRLAGYWDAYAPFRNPFSKKGKGGPDDEGDVENGVHAITKKTDYWFNRELSVLEQEAKQLAAQWAEKGLPRHDMPRTGTLEPEQVLAMKSLELFRQWHRRVRVKMQDQIQAASAALNRLVGDAAASVTSLEATANQRKTTGERIVTLQESKEPEKSRIGYDRIFKSSVGFWIFASILAIAEFTANFPVFRLLLPMDSTLVQLASTLGEAAESHTWLAGPLLLVEDVLLHFEAFLVALIAVVILVLLGKTTGASARAIISFSPKDTPLAATTIRAHRRQHLFVFIAGLLGIVAVLSFMYYARASIAETAQTRVRSDSVSLSQALQQQREAGSDLAKAPAAMQRVKDATRTLQQHLDDAAYAVTVQRVNNAIVLLNIGLVLAAMTLGFVYKKEDLTDTHGEHATLPALRARLQSLEREALVHAHTARRALSAAEAEAGRINHLLESHPLREWQAKQDRLQSIIPIFRGENARARGLDTVSVLAFNTPTKIEFPVVNEDEELRRPTELDRLLSELEEVEDEFGRIASYAIPAGVRPPRWLEKP